MTDSELREQTDKWLLRLKEKRKTVIQKDVRAADYLKNIDAYISDSQYFMQKNDYIRAFEAVVWAWAILDTLEKLEIIECSC